MKRTAWTDFPQIYGDVHTADQRLDGVSYQEVFNAIRKCDYFNDIAWETAQGEFTAAQLVQALASAVEGMDLGMFSLEAEDANKCKRFLGHPFQLDLSYSFPDDWYDWEDDERKEWLENETAYMLQKYDDVDPYVVGPDEAWDTMLCELINMLEPVARDGYPRQFKPEEK